MRAEFCNRFLNIWSGFGAFSHVGNLAEMLDGMNIRVIEETNIRVIEETNTLGRPGRREGGVRGDSGRTRCRLGGTTRPCVFPRGKLGRDA